MKLRQNKTTVLIVLDGWGYREDPIHNAIAQAKTPVFDALWQKYPHTLLEASGLHVGLPHGQMGNSEIGHTTIGAGKVIDTDLVRIAKAIEHDELKNNPAFKKLFAHIKKYNSTLHVKGLLSDGGVHSHHAHLHAFLKTAKKAGVEKIAIHVFTDGRDTAPQSAKGYLEQLEKCIEDLGIGFIATASGRFYAMDRDTNWDRLAKAEEVFFHGKGKSYQTTKPSEIVTGLHANGVLDEHLEPIIFLDETGKNYKVEKNDGIFFFNFRADRARMLSKKIAEKKEAENLCFVTMTEYEKSLLADVAFPVIEIETTLAKEISAVGKTQAHIAETEKFPHATYFLNGGKQDPYPGEEHIVLASRKDVKTHDLAPKMRAESIADKAIEQIQKRVDFIFINFANPDMVGHTANVPAIIEAIEEVDAQLGRVLQALITAGGIAFVTADHGNAEVNIDQTTGEKHTSHTTNPVPAILTDLTHKLCPGTLADITPTILQLMSIQKPSSMTGKSLLQ